MDNIQPHDLVLLGIIGALFSMMVGGLVAWIRDGFRHNREDHRLLFRLIRGISSRVDHVIHHHDGIPPYRPKEGEE